MAEEHLLNAASPAVTITVPSAGSITGALNGVNLNTSIRFYRQNNTVRVFFQIGKTCTKATGIELCPLTVELFSVQDTGGNITFCTDGTGTCDVNYCVGAGTR